MALKFRPSNQPERKNAAKTPTDLWAMVEHVTGHPPGPSNDGSLAYRALFFFWRSRIEERKRSQISNHFFFTHSKVRCVSKTDYFLGFLLRAGDELYWTSTVNGFTSYIIIFPNQQYQIHLILFVAETSWWKCYGNIFRNFKGSEKQAAMT